MAVICDAGHGCRIKCPGSSCWAIYWHDTGHCDTGCCDEALESIKSRLSVRGKSKSKVNFSAKEMELSKLAVVLDTLIPNHNIAIPVAKMGTKTSIDLKDMPLTQVMKSMGLIEISRVKSKSATA